MPDRGPNKDGFLDQLDVHLDQLGVPNPDYLVCEDRLICVHEVTNTLPGLGVLIEDLVVVEVELLGELILPGGNGGLDVGFPFLVMLTLLRAAPTPPHRM